MESIRLRPTWPLELATPLGKASVREFNRMRADSQALAASATTRAGSVSDWRVLRLMKLTPVALPFASTLTERTMASVMICRRPVALAIGSSEVVVWKAAPMEHPLPQLVAQKHGWRLSSGRVRIARRIGTIGMPSFFAAAAINSSGTRGFGGVCSTPGAESGISSIPGLLPQTPISFSASSYHWAISAYSNGQSAPWPSRLNPLKSW